MNRKTNMIIRSSLAFIVCGLLMSYATAQDKSSRSYAVEENNVSLSAELKLKGDGKPRIAEPIQLQIVVEAPQGTSVVMPRVGDSLGDLLVVDSRIAFDLPLDETSTRRRSELLVTLESLSTGIRRTAGMEVLYRLPTSGNGSNAPTTGSSGVDPIQGALAIPPLSMEVVTVLDAGEAPNQFRDIKEGLATPADSDPEGSSVFAWIAGLVGVVLLGIAFAKWHRRSPKPAVWALQQISEIESEHAQGRIPTTDAYVQVSLDLRRYLQLSHDAPARALATDEIAESLAQAGFSKDAIDSASRVLETADACKFSQHAGFDDASSPFDDARCVIAESQTIHAGEVRRGDSDSSLTPRGTIQAGA